MLVPYVELGDVAPPKDLLANSRRLLLERRLLPIADEGDVIVVATPACLIRARWTSFGMAGA